jgi:hypothetical protein
MTVAMTRSLAPGRSDAPQRTGRHGVPPQAPVSPPPAGYEQASPRGSAKLPEPRLVRRIVAGVLVGGLVMFGVATLDTVAGATVPVLGQLAALPSPSSGGTDAVDVPAPPSSPGTCLNWTRRDAADAKVVDCAQPHLFEQAGSVALTDQPALPNDQQWRQLVNERCNPVVEQYLGGKFDPSGRYRIGALKPSGAKWNDGDRELRCGLQSASRSGALYPLTGKAAQSDQSGVQQPGTCLAIDGRTVGDPVDCGGAHAVEAVGIVDLAQKFKDAFPAVKDQDAFLQPACADMANKYAGSADVITQKKLTVYWDNITEDSWKAGSRKVNCNLAALLPDRSGFAPVTGSVKGAVAIGDQPAPPAATTEAGVPAQQPPSPQPTQQPSDPTQPPPASDTPSADPSTSAGATPTDGAQPSGAAATTTPAPGLIPPVAGPGA